MGNSTMTKYKRVLLKLSGEALFGEGLFNYDQTKVDRIIDEILEIKALGVELVLVIGGGNICRGGKTKVSELQKVSAHNIGMLATLMNSLMLRDLINSKKKTARVFSALYAPKVAQFYAPEIALKKLEKGEIIIVGAGTGNSHFSTDTAAALFALELNCDVLLKATKVDGVYDSDPKNNQNSKKYDQLNHTKALTDNLGVMDATALSLCRDNKLNIIVFNLEVPGNIKKVILGEAVGTTVC